MVGGHFGALLVFLWRSAPASGPPYGYPTTKVKLRIQMANKKLNKSKILRVGSGGQKKLSDANKLQGFKKTGKIQTALS